ncbi:MAG: branched-chain amino acid aminotransferase [Sphingomonas fennica]
MTAAPTIRFARDPHPAPIPVDERAAMLVDPGFGRVFTDHMVVARYREGEGWYDARVTARVPFQLDPACAVLHYAQEIFEGMKAYRTAAGGAALFRPEANAARFRTSAARMAMADVPEELFLDAVAALVEVDRDWIPDGEGGSLYLRPFMFASETFLGVRPAHEYVFAVIASSVGAYFKAGAGAISLWVTEDYSRAARGGTGAAKCGGNYAGSLVAQAEAIAHDCDQVVFLDAAEGKWVEELGGMNIFFVLDDGSLVTPPLGTILPGITRDSLITLARGRGLTVREQPYSLADWRADAASGRLVEAFACGTAAVVTPIGQVKSASGDFTIGSGGPGQLSGSLKEQLVAIQRGQAPDPHDWVKPLF